MPLTSLVPVGEGPAEPQATGRGPCLDPRHRSQARSPLAFPSPLPLGSELQLLWDTNPPLPGASPRSVRELLAFLLLPQELCAAPLHSPVPLGAQGLSSGCRRYGGAGFQAISHQLNGINS